MCNRFALPSPDEIAEHFQLAALPPIPPRYNVAPGERILIVRDAGGSRTLDRSVWGLAASRANEARPPQLNVRAETVGAAPDRWQSRGRCLVPAGGFFEWRRLGRTRQPWYFRMKDSPLLALAALSEVAEGGDAVPGERRCAILTTQPNELVAPVHDRMPVILPREVYDSWLDPGARLADLLPLLVPLAAESMVAYPVSSIVNRTGVEDPRAIEPASRETLF